MSEFGSDQQGAVLIEAALVLPIVLLLVFGIVEISLYFWTAGLAVKASQLGIRQAVVSSAVAVGPGLEPAESTTYWAGLPPGQPCFPVQSGPSLCPEFNVVCSTAAGCRCAGTACGFRLVGARLRPILTAMQAVMPDLKPENLELSYRTNGFGYVAQPFPVPVEVRLNLVGVTYTPLFFGNLFGSSVAIRASAELPSESLVTR